jgi:hypothetical protein
MRREAVNYQLQNPSDQTECLQKYLHLAPYLMPQYNEPTKVPTIRHPDLQPNNVFVSEKLEITGLIDWQHCTILPLFLQAGIPGSLQNYGDDIVETLKTPQLPANFDELDEAKKELEMLLYRKRQLHHHYVKETMERNTIHGIALCDGPNVLRRKLFIHAREPWERDNSALKADLVTAAEHWSALMPPDPNDPNTATISDCPIQFTAEETSEALRIATEMEEADQQVKDGMDMMDVGGSQGWMPAEHYGTAVQLAQRLKKGCLEHVETDEETRLTMQHWIFDGIDERDYR